MKPLRLSLRSFVIFVLFGLWGLSALAAAPAQAQEDDTTSKPVPCGLGMVQSSPIIRAGFRPTDIYKTAAEDEAGLTITFVGHATFTIQTAQGATVATDWNGVNVPATLPDIVTMNNFHITHYTDSPDPGIKYVLRGWDPKGGIARHNLKYKDLRVYSVPTNITDEGAGPTNGNSIFVFESAGLCVAHLSHLHHDLSEEEVADLGRIDVLIVPVDGFVTMSHEEVMHIISLIKPRVVIPCHYDFFGGPGRFLSLARNAGYPIKMGDSDSVAISHDSLPQQTEVWVLRDRGGLRGGGGNGGFGGFGGGAPD